MQLKHACRESVPNGAVFGESIHHIYIIMKQRKLSQKQLRHGLHGHPYQTSHRLIVTNHLTCSLDMQPIVLAYMRA